MRRLVPIVFAACAVAVATPASAHAPTPLAHAVSASHALVAIAFAAAALIATTGLLCARARRRWAARSAGALITALVVIHAVQDAPHLVHHLYDHDGGASCASGHAASHDDAVPGITQPLCPGAHEAPIAPSAICRGGTWRVAAPLERGPPA